MRTYKISRHAKGRIQQRGVRAKDLEILMAHADIEMPAQRGCRFLRLSHRAVSSLSVQPAFLVQQIDRVRRLIALVGSRG